MASASGGERPGPEHVGGAIWWHSQARYLFARELTPGQRVLDLACANGYGTILLAERATSVVGADVSAEAVATARRINARANVRYEVLAEKRLPFEDASFDLVVSLETIEHLAAADQPGFVAELSRVLAPEGILVLSTPDRDTERASHRMAGTTNPYHLHTPSPEELDRLLAAFPHRQELREVELIATTVVPVDERPAVEKLGSPIVAWESRERPAPISTVRVCARTAAGLERVSAARSPVAYRADYQRLAFIAEALTKGRLPDLAGLPAGEQVAFLAQRVARIEGRIQEVADALGDRIDRLNRALSPRGILDRLRGRS